MPATTSRPIKAVFFDVGEVLIDESTEYGAWADWLGVPRHTFSAMFGAVIARGEDYRTVFEHLRPGFDLAAERKKRLEAGVGEFFNARDLYPDVRPCLAALKERGYFVGVAGNQTARAGRLLHDLNLGVDLIATSDDWGALRQTIGARRNPRLRSSINWSPCLACRQTKCSMWVTDWRTTSCRRLRSVSELLIFGGGHGVTSKFSHPNESEWTFNWTRSRSCPSASTSFRYLDRPRIVNDVVCEVVITGPSQEWVATFTRQLVEDRLVACGHIIDVIRSIYRWEGSVHDETEARVALHTRRGLLSAIVDRANRDHPYDLPCVIAMPIVDGNPAYIDWILRETVNRQEEK